MKITMLLLVFLWLGKGFLEFEMVRIPMTNTFKSQDKGRCITKEIDEQMEKKHKAKHSDDEDDEEEE
jgi:hypothetical protein